MTKLADRLNLSGKLALVTGASGGLGAHFARTLSEAGATVILAARRLDRLKALETELVEAGGKAFSVAMDVTSPQSVDGAFAAISAEFGRPADIIVNNSGIGQASWFHETPEDEWQSVIETNLNGVWRVAKAATNALIKAGQPGSIVNIASITAQKPAMMNVAYSASKAAVDHMTRNMAVEAARHRIRVNAIAPGYYKTDINADYLESEAGARMAKRIPMRRFGDYQELDGALVLLASDAASYMTGTTITVDGGHTLSPL